jgi:hypothetical protein
VHPDTHEPISLQAEAPADFKELLAVLQSDARRSA